MKTSANSVLLLSCSRHSSGKSGCFSPKTPKAGVRRTVKGFFRRLSGGKDPLVSILVLAITEINYVFMCVT